LAIGRAADLVLFDPQASTLAGETWYSKGQNCPFLGHCLPGLVRYTLVDGQCAISAKRRPRKSPPIGGLFSA